MRDYKFRGQRVDTKEWVYGSLLIDETQCRFSIVNNENGNIYDVISKTVGQYTELMDDAENISATEDIEVYEKDIVTFTYSVKKELKVIVAEVKKEAGMYILASNRLPDGYIPISEIVDCDRDYLWINGVVISNSVDNPELLREESHE